MRVYSSLTKKSRRLGECLRFFWREVMGQLQDASVFMDTAMSCCECGDCVKACPSLTRAQLSLGGIAKGMLKHAAASESDEDFMFELMGDEQLTQAVRGCFICARCQKVCRANNDVCKLIYACRKEYQRLGLIPRAAWSSVQVDQEWDLFKAYRAIFGIGYGDLQKHLENDWGSAQSGMEVAFFPGCSLVSYGPELTREVFAKIEELAGPTTLITECCGSPLKSAGFYERAEALLDRIADELAASGAKQVVCVCPGCRNALQSVIEQRGLACEAVNLTRFLLDHGFKSQQDLSQLNLCVSRSCQDRDGSYLQETLELLGLGADTPVIAGGCCGAGGAVSAFSREQQAEQVARRLSQVGEGQTVVTNCPTCTYTYAFDLMANPRNIGNKNYLELIFKNQFDWEQVSAQLNGMWAGEYADWLAQVFA